MPSPVIVSLPTADRRTTYDFYRALLGVVATGELADDGVPEPLEFAVNDGLHLMFIPPGGFGWVVAPQRKAPRGTSECLLSFGAATDTEVDEVIDRARQAGATVLVEPTTQPWGYCGTFADPDGHLWMVTAEPIPWRSSDARE